MNVWWLKEWMNESIRVKMWINQSINQALNQWAKMWEWIIWSSSLSWSSLTTLSSSCHRHQFDPFKMCNATKLIITTPPWFFVLEFVGLVMWLESWQIRHQRSAFLWLLKPQSFDTNAEATAAKKWRWRGSRSSMLKAMRTRRWRRWMLDAECGRNSTLKVTKTRCWRRQKLNDSRRLT